MKIAIYSPYLDTAGGGEKYMLTIAEALSKKEDVDILIDQHLVSVGVDNIKNRCQSLLGLDFSKINFLIAPIGQGSSFLSRVLFLKKYDWIFYNTDGSIFLSTAKNSIVHFQMPFENTTANGLWGRLKLKSWKQAIYNSVFTKQYIEDRWAISGPVVYPPVNTGMLHPLNKKKQIISVGRFAASTKVKKHQVMIEVFKELSKDKTFKGWSLHLAGGITSGDESYVNELKEVSKGFEIYFYPDASLDDLGKLYSESAIYWHAMGYGEEDPKMSEHFGITTVEAMAAGCVPVVINKGGQPEIVEHEVSGLLWDDLDQFKEYTLKIINNQKLREKLSQNAQERAPKFSKENFVQNLYSLVYGK